MVQWTLVGAGIGLTLAVIMAILGWAVFPIIVRNQIDESVVIVEGTDQYERWVNIPQPIIFKVYIFNVTNANEVQNGQIPVVNEIGPYVYNQYRHKTVDHFSEGGTLVTYTQQQTYHFDHRASAPLTEDDNIVVLNMAMNSILQSLEATQAGLLGTVNQNLNGIFGNPTSMFISTRVRNYLFEGVPFCVDTIGAANFICSIISEQESSSLEPMPDGSIRFSFFNEKNTTHDGIWQVHTGVGDVSRLTEIQQWRGSPVLHEWLNPPNGYSPCNLINGTDSASFRPHLEPGGSLDIFSSDICRSVKVHFDQETVYKGITGYRFVTRDDFLNQIGPQYGTECFCTGTINPNGICLLRGALDLSVCRDAPVVLTLPHMMGADPEYSKVEGLQPDITKHQIFAVIEPNTGYPLQGGRRVQFNMFIRPIDQIDLTANLISVLVPAVWVDEGIALNDEMIQMLNDQLFNILLILDIVHYVLFAVGLAIFVGFTIAFFIQRNKRNQSSTVAGTTRSS